MVTGSIIKHTGVYFCPTNECQRQIKGEKPAYESLEVRKQNQYCVLNVNYQAYRVHVICADILKNEQRFLWAIAKSRVFNCFARLLNDFVWAGNYEN